MAKQYQTAEEWLRKNQQPQKTSSSGQYQTAEEWLAKNRVELRRQKNATRIQADKLRKQLQERRVYRELQKQMVQRLSGEINDVNSVPDNTEPETPRMAFKNAGFPEQKKGNTAGSSAMTPDDVFGSLYDTTTTRQEIAPKASEGAHSKWFQRRLETYVQAQKEGRSQRELDNYLNTLVDAKDITQAEAEEIRGYRTQYEETASYSPKELEDNAENQMLRNYLMRSDVLMGLNESQREYLSREMEAQYQQMQDKVLQQMNDLESSFTASDDEERERIAAELEAAQQELRRLKSDLGAIQTARNLAQRREAISAYEAYRNNPDFDAVSRQARNAVYSRKDDPVGYYLNHPELVAVADNDYSPDNWKNYGMLEEPEIEMYYYLLGTKGSKAARQYLDDIQIMLDKRDYEQTQQLIAETYQDANLPLKFAMNAASITAGVMGNITAPIMDAAGAVTGNYNPYNSGHDLTDYAQTVQGATAAEIQDKVDGIKQLEQERSDLMKQLVQMSVSGRGTTLEQRTVLSKLAQIDEKMEAASGGGISWGKAAANTYQAVMSGAESALGATLFGKGYTALMGSGAASQRARELWEAGASDVQIGLGAVASGLIEMATEKYSVEYFTENFLKGSIQGPKDWLVKTLIQGFNEGSEEVASEIANMAANALILGANSDNQREIRELMESEGLSYDEAKKQAYLNRVLDVFWAGYGGFVSGGTMGGIGGGVNYAQQNSQYRAYGREVINNEAVQDLFQRAQESGVSPELYQLAQEKAAMDLEQMTGRQQRQAQKAIGRLYAATVQAQEEKANAAVRDSFQQAAENKIRETQEAEQSQDQAATEKPKEDPKTAAEALTKAAYGEELTDAEKKTVAAVGGDALIEEITNSREFREDAKAKVEEDARRMSDTMAMTQDTGKQKETVSRFARENGMDEDVMLGSIRRGQDAYAFTSAWESAYEMGAGGIALRYAQKASANSYLTQAQIETAYNEGRKAAGYYEEAEEGSVSDGGQWNDRAYSGGQVRSVESRAAAQGQSGQQGAGGGIAAAAEKITSIQLGLENGTENRNLQRVTEEAYSEDVKAAAKVAKDSGLVFVPFSGGAIETWETVNGNKIKVKSRGCVVNGTMYVRVDDSTFTAEQIARHEAAHEKINRGEIDVKEVKERLLKRYSPEEIDAIIQLYSSAYGDCGMSPQEVLVEIICDSMGRMNAFATDATERVAGEVGVFLRNVRKAAKEAKVGETKNATGDGGMKRSIELDALGRKYVQATRQVIEGNDPAKWGKQIENYINQEIRKGEDVLLPTDDGHILLLTERSAYKLSDRHKQDIRSKVRDLLSDYDFEVKSRMAAHIDELIQVGKFQKYREDLNGNHKNDIGEDGFNYYDAFFRDVDGKYYLVPISAGVNGKEETVYSIGNVEKRRYRTNTGSSSNRGAQKNGAVPSGDIIVYYVGESQVQNSMKEAFEKAKQGKDNTGKYSREMDTVKALERQKKLLKDMTEQRDYWKDQTRLTKVAKADKDAVRKLGREILRGYSSGTKVEDILADLQWLADDAVSQGGASYNELTEAAEQIARKVLEGSGVDVNGDMAGARKELKQYLRSTPINITESIKAGIPDFSDFKNRNRGLRFREDGSGTDVDAMWLELQGQFGTGMFPEDVSKPEDQVRYIAEKVASISEDIQNPYRKDMEFAVQQLTYDILFQTSMVEKKKPTMADKRKERETRAKESVNQEVEKATQELRELVENGRAREKTRVENAQKTSIRQQIRAISDKFQRMATRPGKGISQHAPEGLRKAVVDFCEVFTESELRRMDRWQRNLEYRADEWARKASNVYVATGVVVEAEAIRDAQARRDRMTARLTKLQNEYAAMQKDGQYQTTYDETVADMIKNLSEMLAGKDIYQMETGELRRVQQTMSAIYYTITNANKAFSMGKDKTIIDMATKMAREIRQTNPKQAGMMIAGRRFLQWQMSPDTFFNYLCGYIKGNEGKVIQKGFQQGAERMMGVQREFYQMFREFTESKDKAVHKELSDLMNYSSKRMVNWGLKDLEGNEVKTTRGMMMQAYMMLNQADSFESLKHGGFSLPNAARYYKGDIAGAYGDAVETTMLSESIGTGYTEMIQRNKDLRSRMEDLQQKIEISETESYKQRYQQEINELEKQIRENQKKMEAITSAAAERLYNLQNAIEKQLTPLEKKLIDRAHEWYSQSGKMMADVFEQMYGYRPNLVENYVPIHRDQTTIKTDIRDMAGAEKAFNLENSGFTIDRVKNSQPILLTDFFGELNRQSDKMARYVGFAQVQKDFGKIWKTRIDRSGMTVNTLVRARFGAGKTTLGVSGEEYVNHYIADVAGGHSSDDVLGKFYGNYAAATLRFNPRVAVSQAASIPTAASVVGWKSMAAGFAKGLPKALNTKYRNELAEKNVWFYQRYKGQGGSTELAEIRKKGGIIETIANSGFGKKLFNWCQGVDVWATGSIMWCAAEDYVQSQGIAKGSEEYEAEVNRVYTDIIRKSQPNYTTTERSDLLRDNRAHMKLLTMFKTQSNQNFNLLLEANGEFMRMRQDLKNGRNGVTEADVKAARHKLYNAATGVVVGGQLAFVILRTLVNFAFRAVKPYRDKETDEVTLEATLTAIGKEFLSAMFGTVALGGQIYDVINSVWSGENFYGLNDSAISVISGFIENSIKILQNWKDEDETVTMNQIWKEVNSLCTVLKIPSGNAKKYVYDMWKSYDTDIKKGDLLAFTSEDTTNKQYRARIVKHYLAGEMDKAADALAMLFEKSSADTDDEANEEIASGMRSYLQDMYIQGEVSDVEAEKIMKYTGTDDPEKYTARWDFYLAHPEIDKRKVSDTMVAAYEKKGSISDEVFFDAWEFVQNAETDKDKDGKPINGSKKQKIEDYIAAIPGLSWSQEKKLFELLPTGSSVKGTRWE